jgi:hypothetical protein
MRRSRPSTQQSSQHLNKYFGAPNDHPAKKGRSNKANSPFFHFNIHTAEKIVPAIDRIITPAVFIKIASMRFSLALICSYRIAQTSSCVDSRASVASMFAIAYLLPRYASSRHRVLLQLNVLSQSSFSGFF